MRASSLALCAAVLLAGSGAARADEQAPVSAEPQTQTDQPAGAEPPETEQWAIHGQIVDPVLVLADDGVEPEDE